MDKEMEYLSTLKKEGIPAIFDNMRDLEDTMLSEIRQTEKSKYLYVECKIVKLIQAEARMVVARGWRDGEMGSWLSKDTKFQLSR